MKPFTCVPSCILALLVFCCTACHKDSSTNYARYPLQLKATRSLEGVRFEWTVLTLASNFVHYQIWRSNTEDTIPDNLEVRTNPNGLKNIVAVDSTLSIIDNVAFDRLTDLSFLKNNQSEAYYRVAAVFKNRVVLSPNIKVQAFSSLIIPSYGKDAQAIMNVTKDRLFVFTEDKILVFDSEQERFIKTVALPSTFMFSNNYALSLGNENGVEVIYVGNGTDLSVLKASDLSEIETISFTDFFSESISHISTDGNGLLYLSVDGSTGALYTLNRTANNEIVGYSNSSSNGSNWVYEYSPMVKKIIGLKFNIAVGTQRIAYMKLSPVLKTVSYDNSLSINTSTQNSFISTPFRFLFYDDGLFIVDKIGLQFNADLNQSEPIFEGTMTQGPYVAQKYLSDNYLFIAPNKRLAAYGGLHTPTFSKNLATVPQDIFPMNGKIWLINNATSNLGEKISFIEKISF